MRILTIIIGFAAAGVFLLAPRTNTKLLQLASYAERGFTAMAKQSSK